MEDQKKIPDALMDLLWKKYLQQTPPPRLPSLEKVESGDQTRGNRDLAYRDLAQRV